MSLPSDNLLQPDAYTVSDEQSRGALRCIDRNVTLYLWEAAE